LLSSNIRTEEKKMFHSLLVPLLIVVLMWAVKIIEVVGGYEFAVLGIFPRTLSGLPGILTTPFVHGDFQHLMANTVPILVLGSALFYFYKDIAFRILLFIWVLTGLWVWIGARPSYHIGASGIVYGLSAFIFASGIIRRHTGLMSVALVVVFLYGSLIWGIFPEFFPKDPISWESHLFGLVAGAALALVYRKEGPQRRVYSWEFEEEEDDEQDDGPPDGPPPPREDRTIWRSDIS
jgi:membrane associated rhomboid family serine protease